MDDASRGVSNSDPAALAATDPNTTRRTAELRSEIEQTRVEMSETIEALQDKLTPANLVADARDSVKEAAGRKVQQMANTAEGMADQVLDSSIVQTVRSNPLPAAMIAIGAGWLLLKRRSASDSSRGAYSGGRRTREWRQYGSSGTAAEREGSYGATSYGGPYGSGGTTGGLGSGSSAAVGTSGRGGNISAGGGHYPGGVEDGGAARGTYGNPGWDRQSGGGFERVIRDNPLALGAAAVLVGAAIGMSMPSTEAENEWMGEARDSVMDSAREMASSAAETLGDVASQVQGAAGGASQAVGGTTGSSGSSTGSTGSTGSTIGQHSTGSTIGGSGSIG
jgi:hypothetical protein